MWEVPASRWAAVCDDGGDGMAIVAEARYGFSCRDGRLGLSLLRSPQDSSPHAPAWTDKGRHRIRFALGRHRARTDGDSLATAAAVETLFAPVLVVAGGRMIPAPLRLENLGTLVPSWLAPAERTPGLILRLHETAGSAGHARLLLARPVRSVTLVDLLEQPVGRLTRLDKRIYDLNYGPYAVLSVRISLPPPRPDTKTAANHLDIP
jgi:alpha-mannosidase